MGFFDQGYALSDSVVGPVHALIAPVADVETVPANIADIIAMVADEDGAYAAAEGWRYVGLAADSQSYSVTHDSDQIEYEQPSGAVAESLSALERAMSLNLGSINAENLRLIEQAGAPESIAAATGKSAQTAVKFGSYTDLALYRVALIAQRKQALAAVKEGASGPTRGAFVVDLLYRATLAADDREIEYSKGEPTGATLGLVAYAEPDQPPNEEHGVHLLETPGTIAVT